MTAAIGPGDSTYLFDNAGRETPARFAALSALFDPGTIRHLEDRGVGPGWHCLEVGGGGGSIATWLAARVAPTGTVLVTDIDPRFLESSNPPNLVVRCHNIVTDPLPEATFDLVYARLVLMHLPERAKVLDRMIDALKSGGWLVVEDFDSASMPPDPTVSPGEVSLKTHVAMRKLQDSRGVDRRCGCRLFGRLRAHGLISVGAEARIFMLASGFPGASWLSANYEQLRSAMIDVGDITENDFNQDLARLDDPNFMMPSPILWAAWGRRL
jgi:SAM-dependent methyltransferase